MMFNVKRIIFGIITLLLVAGLVWFFRTEIKNLINRVPNSPVIIFPATQDRVLMNKDFDNNSVALEISHFIPEEAEEKTLWRLKYSGVEPSKVMGFGLEYKLDLGDYSLTKFYERQLNTAKDDGWKLLAANLGESQVFLDIERKNPAAGYKVRILAEQKNGSLDVGAQYLITRD